MIQISIQTKNGKIIGMDIQGHAEYAEHGKDIVCAGVSTVAIGLLNALDYLNAKCSCSMENNQISVRVTESDDELTQIILTTAKIQLETIQESYKKYIKIKRQEV